MADDLVRRGKAYYCYCTPEELKAKREAAEAAGGAWKYDRTCCRLTPSQVAANEAAERSRAVRFLVPEGVTRFDDLVHGLIEFDGANIDDFVILRSDGQPTYHLSVVSDDGEMKMTHVIRGDDHISNTPKQVLLYQAVGAPVPAFAHVPLILGADKKRLSKRHGATSVMEYARQGYLPEAMANFLALLGWSPGSGDRELFTLDDLAEQFDLRGISGGNAVFNPEKLDWFNQQYIMRLAPDDLARRLKPWFEAAGLWDDAFLDDRHAWFFEILELLKPRARRLDEFVSLGRFFFSDQLELDEAAVAKHLRAEGMPGHLQALLDALSPSGSFDPVTLEAVVRGVAASRGLKAGPLIHAVRVAVTGRTVSPGLFEVLSLLGEERVRVRLQAAIALGGEGT
jgi:glutamyl-tRNA synthetase